MEIYKHIFEINPEALLLTDVSGRIERSNSQAEIVFGYSRDELAGCNIEVLIAERSISEYSRYKTESLKKKNNSAVFAGLEIFGKRKDRTELAIELTLTLIESEREPTILYVVRDVTGRKQTEEALRHSEEVFRNFFDFASSGMALVDLKGRWLRVNQTLCDIVGYTKEEILRIDFQSLTFPDDLPDDLEYLRRSLSGELSYHHREKRYIHKKGHIVWISLSAALLRDREGKPLYFISQLEDITVRKRAEEELRRVNRALRTLSNCNQILVHASGEEELLQKACEVIIFDGGYKLVWVGYIEKDEQKSIRPVAVAGADKKEIEALKLTWGDNEKGNGPMGTALRTGKPTTSRDLFNDPNFSNWKEEFKTRGVSSCLALPLKNDGEVFGAISMFSAEVDAFDEQEIKLLTELAEDLAYGIQTFRTGTKRHEAEEALKVSEARLKSVVEGMPILMDAFDENGQIVAWNSECERVTGYSAEEIVGNPKAMELLYPDSEYRERLLKDFESKGINYRSWSLDLTTKDGNIRTIEWSSEAGKFPIPGWAIWAVGVDVTERLQLEEQLRQAQKMQALGQLAGGVAHDFNNLLTVINGYSDLLLSNKEPLDETKTRSISAIRDAGQRAALLTRQLLLFSRKAVSEPKVLDLNEVIEQTIKMLRRLIGEDVTLTTHMDSSRYRILADRGQIEQVIMNLSLNARDAMPTGGQLAIETKNFVFDEKQRSKFPEGKPGRFVELSVSDNGCGMSPEVQQHIFEPFYTTKGPGKGTGLGLATVYGIVEQAGGFIHVETEEGNGSNFYIFFPALDIQPGPTHSEEPESQKMHGVETILLVEDETDVREIIRLSLETNGYFVLEAANGFEALDKVDRHVGKIDLVVTDVVMPDMSGSQLAGLLHSKGLESKILFISGYNEDAIIRHGLSERKEHLLQKPFSQSALVKKVRELLDS